MGKPYLVLEQHLKNLMVDPEQDIVLEIGSERGDGSTEFLHRWAKHKQLDLYSVDVVKYDGGIFDNNEIRFVTCESGSSWCRDVLPTLNKRIKVLYLDNFDYIPPGWENLEKIKTQIKQYASRGVTQTNENCMEEHRMQAKFCMPYMCDESVIIVDDTTFDQTAFDTGKNIEQTWQGKGSRVVSVLMENYYTIEPADNVGICAYRHQPGSWKSSKEIHNDTR
jgi:hypothetical protein